MKYLKTIIAIFSICAGLISCTEEKVEEKTYSILFLENPVMVGSNGGACTCSFVSDHQWTADAVSKWITDVTVTDGEVSFTVEANPTEDTRNGKIRFTVSGDDYTQDLTVRQLGNTGGLKAEKTSVTLKTIGEEAAVKVTAAENWDVTSEQPEWLTAVRKNSTTLTLTANANYSGEKRSSKVTVQTASKKESITINVEQEYEENAFGGATTEKGRWFVHRTGQLVTSVTTEKAYDINDHISAFEMQFTNRSGSSYAPYSIFVFEVDLTGDVTILASCVNDNPASIKTTDQEWTEVATMREQFYAMQQNRPEIDLLCGINGDFCYGNSNYQRKNFLHGIMYKDGKCLKDTFDGGAVCTVFAMMKDGTARIMTQADYAKYKGDIQEAIGGRVHLLSGGQKFNFTDTSLEPRTAVGVSGDKNKVIMLVVDGRRSNYSVGANYNFLATILQAFGATDAINLDGGGSSTFLVKNSAASKGFETRNRPTDNTGDRAIPNGLAVVRKK